MNACKQNVLANVVCFDAVIRSKSVVITGLKNNEVGSFYDDSTYYDNLTLVLHSAAVFHLDLIS